MARILALGLLISLLLSGCGFVQEFYNPEPEFTLVNDPVSTLASTSSPDQSAMITPSPAVTRALATPSNGTVVPTIESGASEFDPQAFSASTSYTLQAGSPRWLPNFSHPELGCNFLAVAGQVFGSAGAPEQMLIIEAGGSLGGQDIFALSLTGNNLLYGPGGFELILSDRPLPSNDSVWLQVFNLDGQMISDRIYIDTFDDCQRNLILVNFVESSFTGGEKRLYFPNVYKNYVFPLP